MKQITALRAKYRALQIRILSEGLEACKKLEPDGIKEPEKVDLMSSE